MLNGPKLTVLYTFGVPFRTNNAIPIASWFSDPNDTCLLNLLPFLDALRFTSDVRSVLSRNLQALPETQTVQYY
uniref:FCP1 homology domain-containing protein n=1 Tax=Caenorhabditis japonica TaxID=281687 RepID=A0A8R1ILB6_CAEJA